MSTPQISQSAAGAREAARQDNGQFGTQPRAEVDIDDLFEAPQPEPVLPLLRATDSWGALTESVEQLRREAYEAGQRDAYAKAAQLIHDFDTPSLALKGHVMREPNGRFSVEVPEECGYEMADKVLGAASDSLRAYATGGFAEEAEKYVAGTGTADQEPACGPCKGTGYEREIGDGLWSGTCETCLGSGDAANPATDNIICGRCDGGGYEPGRDGVTCNACGGAQRHTLPGDDAVTCTYCEGMHRGMPAGTKACPVCGTSGKMAPTPTEQEQVFVPGYGTFYRSGMRNGDGTFPGTPYFVRLEANRPLTDDETQRAAQLLGYNYRTAIAGEPLGKPVRDSDRSFIVSADSTKSRRDDIGVAFEEFEANLDEMLHDGSPVRTTDRAGAGTKGTRLVEGFGDPDLVFTPYYDDVC